MQSRVRKLVSPFAGLGDGNALPLEVLAQTVVKLGQAAQLQVGHGLFVLFDLSRVANVAGGVQRHVGVGGRLVKQKGWVGLAVIYVGGRDVGVLEAMQAVGEVGLGGRVRDATARRSGALLVLVLLVRRHGGGQ